MKSNKFSLTELEKENMRAISDLLRSTDQMSMRHILLDLMNDVLVSMKGICLIINRKGQIEYCNHVFSEMVGEAYIEIKGKSFSDYLHPEDLQKTLDVYEIREEKKRPVTFFNRYRSSEHGWQWIGWPPATSAHRDLMIAVGYLVQGPQDPLPARWS